MCVVPTILGVSPRGWRGPERLVVDIQEHEDVAGHRWLFAAMLISALASLTASFVLSVDALTIASHPNVVLPCDINRVVTCGTVARTWQASLLGFPNAYLGLMCEPVVITVAVAGLAGMSFPRWFMTAAQSVYLAGVAFALWLFFQSAFVIHAFCPWCLLVTLGSTVTFFTMLRYNVLSGKLPLTPRVQLWARRAVGAHGDLACVVIIVATLVSVILIKDGSVLLGGR